MQNAKIPFALDDNGKIFCYENSKVLDADGIYALKNGTCYDMAVLAQLIKRGEDIGDAIIGRVPATGDAHWVFDPEKKVLNEVSARSSEADEIEELRKRIDLVTAENDALRQTVRGMIQDRNDLPERKNVNRPLTEEERAADEHTRALAESTADLSEAREQMMADAFNADFGKEGRDANGSPVGDEDHKGGDEKTS